MNVSRSYGGAPLGEGQRGAMEKLRVLHAAMGANDAMIVRLVCGEASPPPKRCAASAATAIATPPWRVPRGAGLRQVVREPPRSARAVVTYL